MVDFLFQVKPFQYHQQDTVKFHQHYVVVGSWAPTVALNCQRGAYIPRERDKNRPHRTTLGAGLQHNGQHTHDKSLYELEVIRLKNVIFSHVFILYPSTFTNPGPCCRGCRLHRRLDSEQIVIVPTVYPVSTSWRDRPGKPLRCRWWIPEALDTHPTYAFRATIWQQQQKNLLYLLILIFLLLYFFSQCQSQIIYIFYCFLTIDSRVEDRPFKPGFP